MTLGDAIIAGTALVYGLTLITRNTDYQLVGDSYEPRQFRLSETIVSPLLPALQLKLDDVMP